MAIEKIEILGAVLELPAKLHSVTYTQKKKNIEPPFLVILSTSLSATGSRKINDFYPNKNGFSQNQILRLICFVKMIISTKWLYLCKTICKFF